jgi:MFS transporter, DHA1 family, solute carrier family 18 (vesicular amine transporter), member 1/2
LRRPVVLLLYTAVFAGEVMWSAIVPLVPAYAHRFSLSPLQAGVLLASASVAILLVSVPAGVAGGRLGARRVTLAAMVVLALADAGQGLAGSYWQLLAARTLFGVGFGILWTTGLAWLTELTGEGESRALSLTVTTAGLGNVAGPAFAGVLVQHFGLAAPFAVLAAVTVALTVALASDRSGAGRAPAPAEPTGRSLRIAFTDRRVAASLALMGLGGLLGGAVNLLVPLQLHRNGITTASIGVAFAVSAVLFIGSSAFVARLGDRAVRPGVGAAATAAAAATLAVVLVSASTVAVVGFLLLRGPVAAVLYTITFPLGVRGGREAGISVATMAALLNIVWALSTLVAPILAGALAQTAGDRAAYGLVAVLCLAAAPWIAAARPPAPAARAASSTSA